MGATDCIEYQVAEKVVDAMKLIKTASGYKYNVPDTNVSFAKLVLETPDPTEICILVDLLSADVSNDRAHSIEQWVNYNCYFFNSTTGHTSENPCVIDDNKNAAADMIKALKAQDFTDLSLHAEIRGWGHGLGDEGTPYTYVSARNQVVVNGSNPYST